METKRKTTLIKKKTQKEPSQTIIDPLIPMMWKIRTEQIKEEIYYLLISRGPFPKEQKGCRKGKRKTDLLYIDQYIFKGKKRRRKNFVMVWINYKKVCDIVP